MFIGSEIDELDNPKLEFDDERNPKSTTRAIMGTTEQIGGNRRAP
jgi:hypothetical protein